MDGCGSGSIGGGPCYTGYWYLQHIGVALFVVALGVAVVLVLYVLGREQEHRRKHSRYEVDDRLHVKRVPPEDDE